jgi:DNA polymerase-3 subunit gamma/tau
MSYLVLARKWRPQTFEEIVGQEHIATTLQNAIRTDRVAHAFLFTGVRGVGKTTAARVLAKALNCENGPTPHPCNVCRNCTEITAGTSVDVLEIDGASNTGVDDVREIIENVRYRPSSSRLKIYIIDEVHMLSTSAFNALLKTLEEPPEHVKFIFATTDPHKVPHTIHSRCQRYDFKRIAYRQIVDRLLEIARADGITVGERGLFLIAREAEGSMRDAQSLFDQVIAFAGNAVRDEDVSAALGLADRERLYQLATAIAGREPQRALELLNQLYDYGYDLRRLTRELLEYFRNLSIARLLPGSDMLGDLPGEERTQLEATAASVSHEDLDRAFRLLLQTEGEVARVAYPKLVLDMAIIKLATLAPVIPGDEILRRIDALVAGGASGAAGGSGHAASHARVRTTTPSAPVPQAPHPSPTATAAPAPSPAPAAATRRSDDDVSSAPAETRTWSGFLEFVTRSKVTMKPYLDASPAPDVTANTFALRVPAGYFYDYLVQKEAVAAVEDLAARYFGRTIRVSVAELSSEASDAPTGPSNAELHDRALGNPIVKAAIEVFGGQVQEVRQRRRPQRGPS